MLQNFEYLILPEAKADLMKALRWYGAQDESLPKRFRIDFKVSISSITANPFAHTIRYSNIRIATMKVFPFGLHYMIEEAARICLTVGIYHESSNP